MRKITKIFLLVVLAVVIIAAVYLYPRYLDKEEPVDLVVNEPAKQPEVVLDVETSSEQTEITEEIEDKLPETEEKLEPLSASHKLEAPFIPQAPYHDWSEPWQNACEEAAILVAHHYLKGNQVVSKEQVKKELQDMINWQMKYYGTHKDLKAAEVVEVIEKYLGYENVEVTYDISIEDIKREVAAGNPVIIPAAGRELNNPNFTAPGPVYHMLTVIGYTEGRIITNDPGTRKGKDFTYTYQNFYDSIHDYVDGASKKNPGLMGQGRRAMVVIYPD